MQFYIHSSFAPSGWKVRSLGLAILKVLAQKKLLKGFVRAECNISFVGPGKMALLNEKYRRKKSPTDILSFESQIPHSLGDLVICPSVLKRQAKDCGHSINTELAVLMVHGFLHLLGHDHEGLGVANLKKAKLMQGLENEILKSLVRKQLIKSGPQTLLGGLILRSGLEK